MDFYQSSPLKPYKFNKKIIGVFVVVAVILVAIVLIIYQKEISSFFSSIKESGTSKPLSPEEISNMAKNASLEEKTVLSKSQINNMAKNAEFGQEGSSVIDPEEFSNMEKNSQVIE